MSRCVDNLMWGTILLATLCGCATTSDQFTQNSRAWGSDATLLPSWHRIGRAAANAARDPQTWGPVVGAALFSATDWDKDVSDWAQRHHPVYGSQDAALTASDDLRDGAKYGAIVTALLTPNGPDATAASIGKLKGMGLQLGAYVATESVTTVFKRGVARRRPSGANNRSFPSGHTVSSRGICPKYNRLYTFVLGQRQQFLLQPARFDALIHGALSNSIYHSDSRL